ncbi:hypothetical protein EDC14_1007145 [Hydrogenispora ethanolica]|uniref:Uncharacterized protein n=1 Tax=Hydrogenispora ethanolica TaxID=1082276 RepID=A0A4R1RY49_HYDET|nr:hypothetical protein EDC14_1007145 [Hydrogenispora ethanolica]
METVAILSFLVFNQTQKSLEALSLRNSNRLQGRRRTPHIFVDEKPAVVSGSLHLVASRNARDGGGMLEPRMNEEVLEPRFSGAGRPKDEAPWMEKAESNWAESKGARSEALRFQKVKFQPRKGPASHRESSLELWKAMTITKRRQSERQTVTKVKPSSPVKPVKWMPTGSLDWEGNSRCGTKATASENPSGSKSTVCREKEPQGTLEAQWLSKRETEAKDKAEQPRMPLGGGLTRSTNEVR